MKAKALKEKAKSAKPITAMTVYPPNTPPKMVSKVLPTKSQVQVNIYSVVQLFSEFDHTCKKRITPTSLTEGERGFEQTNTCYLTKIILFFKTIKEHFEGIQKALVNEIKEMKEFFDQMEVEVDQHAVDKKCDEIERKNLLIENENLIAECLSKDIFYIATDYVLNVSTFSDMHDAYTVAQKCITELEAENSNLTQKIQKDDHDEMIKHFSKLEVDHLNLQLKYQHLKERFGNKNSVTSSDAPVFESVFEIGNLKEQFQGRGNTIRELKAKISRLKKKHCEADPILDFKALDSHNKDLNAKIKGKTKCVTMPDLVKPKVLAPGTLREIVEEARVEKPLDSSLASACLYTKHSQELLEYVIGTCPKDFNKRDRKIATAPLNRQKRVTFVKPGETSTNNSQTHVEQQTPKKTNEPMIPSTGVKDATAASGSKPKSNRKKDRTLPAKSDMKKVAAHSRNNKSSVKQKNRVNSSISFKRIVINSNSTSVCKTCNKCLLSFNHDKCVVKSLKFVKKPPVNKVWRVKQVKQVWQATEKLFTNVGFQWQPTERKFTLGEQCPLTRFIESKVVPAKQPKSVVQIVLWYLDSGYSKHMTGDRSRLKNFIKKFIGTVRFGNDLFGAIMGNRDYVIGDSVISRVYYVEGLGHNLFSVGQFCDSDLEVAFRKHSCYVRDVNGVDLIKGDRGTNLYTISVLNSSPICLLSKASKNKSWLWHRRFTWVKFLRSKDETPEFVIKILKQIQVGLNKTVRYIRTDNGTEFVNQFLTKYYESVSIFHQKLVSKTPQQNDIVERRNRTLVEATRKMLIFSKAPMFLWAEAVATACCTQN
ncbi:putative ribonuclease H-like domain-containing protein [Tanacetum coccineum]